MECDAAQVANDCVIDNFNPRTHMECDLNLVKNLLDYKISIHALTWSAT